MFIERFENYLRNHQILRRLYATVFYALSMSVAMNFFWKPGNIFSSGFTGLAQVINGFLHLDNVGLILFIINIPMIFIAWKFIGNRFTFFTILAVVLGSIFIQFIPQLKPPISNDPIIDAIFGGAINGLGTGVALRNGVATGGLDVLSVILKKKFNIKIFPISLIFNIFIILSSSIIFGWQHAFYSILGIVISSWISSSLYSRQQLMQVMVVTDKKTVVIESIQNRLRRGISVVKSVEGGYLGDSKNILLTVVTNEEIPTIHQAIKEADPKSFTSVWKVERTFGRFYENEY